MCAGSLPYIVYEEFGSDGEVVHWMEELYGSREVACRVVGWLPPKGEHVETTLQDAEPADRNGYDVPIPCGWRIPAECRTSTRETTLKVET